MAEAEAAAGPVTVLCAECGSVIEIQNPSLLILALHQANACEQVSDLFAPQD